MTSELIERVAGAISETRTGNSLSWRHYVAEAQAAIAAMQADAAPVAWMPIETAPKDGTEIILWPGLRHPVDGVIPPAVGAWHKYRELECWDDLAVGHHNGYWKPTHWMPLPAAPVDDRVSTSSPVVAHKTPETSVKLRDAVEVYQQAYVTWVSDQHKDNAAAYTAAAAVIEADREAVRAEQAAEVERLTLTVRKLQGHQAALESYLREIRDKPVARSSDAWKRHCLKLQAIAAEALGDVA